MIEMTYENLWHLINVMREYEEKGNNEAACVMEDTISWWMDKVQ